jgi:hypothetical protein
VIKIKFREQKKSEPYCTLYSMGKWTYIVWMTVTAEEISKQQPIHSNGKSKYMENKA